MQPLETKRYFPKTNKYLPVWLKRSLMQSEQKVPHHATSIKKKSRVTRFLKGKSQKILTYIEKYLLRGRPPDGDLLPLKMYPQVA